MIVEKVIQVCGSFAAVRDGNWYWGLGDPDLGAVLVTGLYFLTAIICLVVSRGLRGGGNGVRSQKPARPCGCFALLTPDPVSGPGEARFWLVLALILFCLGVNKQADFQSLLTLYGRDILHHAGLHDVRRPIQVAFILGVAVVSLLGVVISLWLVRRWSWPCKFAAVGLGIQAAFIVVRAASFHHVDVLLRMRLGNLKLNLLFESIGLTVMLLSAMAAWAKGRAEGNPESSVGSRQ